MYHGSMFVNPLVEFLEVKYLVLEVKDAKKALTKFPLCFQSYQSFCRDLGGAKML